LNFFFNFFFLDVFLSSSQHVSQAPIVFLNMFSIAPYFFLYDVPNVVLLEPNIGQKEYFYIEKFPKLENSFVMGQSKKLIVKKVLKLTMNLEGTPN
jgi:hypothetical protein